MGGRRHAWVRKARLAVRVAADGDDYVLLGYVAVSAAEGEEAGGWGAHTYTGRRCLSVDDSKEIDGINTYPFDKAQSKNGRNLL